MTQNKVLFQDEGGGGPRLSELPPFTQLTTICQFTSPAWPHMSGLERIPLGHRVLAWIQAPYRAPEDASPATQSFYIKYEPKTRDHQLYAENQVSSFWIKLKKEEHEERDTNQVTGRHLEIILPRGASRGLSGKESTCQAGDRGLVPDWGRSHLPQAAKPTHHNDWACAVRPEVHTP